MASRSERRRRARQRAIERAELRESARPDHTSRMMAVVVKAADSRQPTVANQGGIWNPDRDVPPPIPPQWLWAMFEQNSVHSGAINSKVADSVGRGWNLTPEDDSEEGADGDVDHLTRQLTDLLKIVCPKLTFSQLCQQAVRELDAIGWAGWEILRDTPGDVTSEITGILPIPAQHLRAVRDDPTLWVLARGDKKVWFKKFGTPEQLNFETGDKGDGVPEEKRANEIVVFSHYSPRSDYYGIPPWISATPAIAELTAMREFNVSFFESGGTADRSIHVTAKDEGIAEGIARSLAKQMADARGQAHVSVVSWGSEDTQVAINSLEPKSAQSTGRDTAFRAGRADCVNEVLMAHQVPPYRVGLAITGTLGGDTADEMDDSYRIGVIEPMQEILEAELERTIFGEQGFGEMLAGYLFEFVDMTKDDEAANHAQAMEARDKGVMSPNDAREAIGEDRIDDPALDRHYIGGQPISTDAGVTDVKGMLAELRDALRAAVGAKTEQQSDPDEPDPDYATDDGEGDGIMMSESPIRAWLRRRRG